MSRVFDFLLADPSDAGGWGQWLTAHYLDHLQILQAAQVANPSANFPVFDLAMWRPDAKTWDNDHQQMHNTINAAIASSSSDMTEIDWKDPNSWSTFLSYNSDEHQKFWAAFGIT